MSDNGNPHDPERPIFDRFVRENVKTPDDRRYLADLVMNLSKVEQPLQADPWQAFTLADAYEEREPVEYVAAGLFALPSLNIVYGSPGTLKSFLLQDLAVCVAAGVEWLPPAPWVNGNQARGIATLRQPTIWLDFDNGRRRTHDRFGALGRARNLPPDSPIIYYSMPAPWLDSSDKTSIGELTLRIQDKGAKFVVTDNLGVVSGDAEENSGEMARVMSLWRQLAEDTGAAVVLVHHQRKSNGTIGRAGDSLRGHSSIEAALDLALLIDREDYSDTANIRATKTRGPDVLPFSAAFTFEHDERGELQTAKFFGIVAEDNKSDAAIEREIRAALSMESTNKTGLVKAVREALKDDSSKSPGVNRIRNIVERLESQGRIRAGSGNSTSNTEKVYSLP